MFKAIRAFTKYGREQRTVKEYETAEKATAYARRYSTSGNFIKCEVFDENGALIFRITPEGEETITPKKEEPVAAEPKVEQPELFTQEGEVAVKIHMVGESRKKGRICHFKTETAAFRYAKKKLIKCGNFITEMTVYRGDKTLAIWNGGWDWLIKPKKRDPCRKNARASC